MCKNTIYLIGLFLFIISQNAFSQENSRIYNNKYSSLIWNQKCEVALQKAIEVGEVSTEIANGYRNIKWAPIFFNNRKPTDGVKLFCSCEEALKSYGKFFK